MRWGVSSTLHLEWRGTITNSSVFLNCPCLDTNEFEEKNFRKKQNRSNLFFDRVLLICIYQRIPLVLFHILLSVILKYFIISVPILCICYSYSFSTDGFIKEKYISLCRGKQQKENESRHTRRKDAICTDQLSQWDWLHFNVFEGKPWCAMSLSSFLSVSVITVISLNQVKMRNEFNNTWVWQPCL